MCFIGAAAGTAVLLDNTTQNSNLQPRIRDSMRRLIMDSHNQKSQEILAMIQENVSNDDFLMWKMQPYAEDSAFTTHAF